MNRMALGLLRRRRSRGGPGAAPDLSLPLPAGAGAYGCEVVDPLGQPLGGAEVTVTALDSHRVAAHGTTDPYGLFMAALPPGSTPPAPNPAPSLLGSPAAPLPRSPAPRPANRAARRAKRKGARRAA